MSANTETTFMERLKRCFNPSQKIAHDLARFDWPELPPLPEPRRIVLIRVATSLIRARARQESRAALREILAHWSGLSPHELPLEETPRGPVWPGKLAGYALDISLSYAEGEACIALIRDAAIGLDILSVQPIPEAREVARHYLSPEALEVIEESSDPDLAFAKEWTRLEARLKCLKQPLGEFSAIEGFQTSRCATRTWVLQNGMVVSVTTGRSRPDFQTLAGGGFPLSLVEAVKHF